MNLKKRYLFRIIIPAFPSFNIYSGIAKTTTALGPICIATVANKLARWDVEVIDENNCRSRFCPKDDSGRPDHLALQASRPADVVGFYGSLSSTIPRLYEIAELYRSRNVLTVTGGKHVENLPEEALQNHLDIVVFGDGEDAIVEILSAWENDQDFESIPGIAIQKDGRMFKTADHPLITDFTAYPFPDFNLIRYAKLSLYPLNRVRGCNNRCEFCAVKDRTRCSSPRWMMAQIEHLVETQNAGVFFEASDHFAADKDETIEFCHLLAAYQAKIGRKLSMNIQTRITDARYPDLLEAMKQANINMVCIGYESPIDAELIAMKKGYLSKDMVRWTEIFHEYGFFIHGMFMFGYPQKPENAVHMTLDERVSRFKAFIKAAKIDTIQLLLTVPLPGTELRERLTEENRLYALSRIGWEYYDGQFPVFEPDDGIPPEDLQKAVVGIMSRYYHLRNLFNISVTIVFHFPRMVFLPAFSIVTLKVRYLTRAFQKWYRRYFRNTAIRLGGFFIIHNWFKQFRRSEFLKRLELARKDLHPKA